MPVTSVYRAGGGYGIVSDPGPGGAVVAAIPKLLPPILGNVLRVDAVNGSSLGSPGGLPYLTIETALAAATSGTTVWVMPGTYNLSSPDTGLVIPAGVSLRGVSTQTVNINYTGGSVAGGNYVMFAPAANTRIEDVTINCGAITAASGTTTTTAVLVKYPESTKIRTCVINVTSTATDGSAAYGVRSTTLLSETPGSVDSAGNPTAKMFSFNTLKGVTVNVFSSGSGASGARRGILVDGTTASCLTCRDTNIFIGAPSGANPGTGSYVGVETNCTVAALGQGTVQLRNSSVGSCVGSLLANTGLFTASDVLQTTPATVTPGTTKTGIILGSGTDLITKSAGSKPLNVTTFPNTLSYNLKGTGTGWLSQGIQTAPDSLNNAPFTGQYFVTDTATNNITLNTTAGLSVGTPIRFGTTMNSLMENTTYYLLTIAASNVITVGSTVSGTAISGGSGLSSSVTIPTITSVLPGTTTPTSLVSANLTASGVTNQYVVTSVASSTLTLNTTAGMVIGQPIQFDSNMPLAGGTGVVAGTTYYIATIPSTTTLTIRNQNFGSPTQITMDNIATANYSNVVTLPTQSLEVSSIDVGVYKTLAVTAANVITMNTTAGLAVGLPISFGAPIAGSTPGTADIIAGTRYYISAVNATSISVTSANSGGTDRALATQASFSTTVTPTTSISNFTLPANASGNTITTASPHNLVAGTIVRTGVAYGTNLAANTNYYVRATGLTANAFTLSTTPGGGEATIGAATAVTDATVRYTILTGTVASAASGSTLTIASGPTNRLVPGMPISFASALGSITAATGVNSYVVCEVLTTGATGTFNVALASSPTTPVVPGSAVSNVAFAVETIPPANNSILNFVNFTTPHNLVVGSGVYLPATVAGSSLTASTIYYVQNNVTTNMVSLTANPSTVASALITQALGTVSPGSLNAVHTLNSTNYTSLSIGSAATGQFLTLASGPLNHLVVGMPIIFGAALGNNILANTTYFVRSHSTAGATAVITVSLAAKGTAISIASGGSQSSVSLWAVALPTTVASGSPISMSTVPASSNLVTFSAAHTLLVGDAVVFNQALGPFAAATLYYVIVVPNTTQVMLSTLPGQNVVAITAPVSTTTGVLAYYNASAGTVTLADSTTLTLVGGAANTTLSPGMPITFSSTVGSVSAGTVVYVTSNPPPSSGATGTFSVSSTPGGAALTNVAAAGVSYSAFGTGVQPQYFVTTTAGSSSDNITLNTTAGLSVGMPIQFGTALNSTAGNIDAGVTYFIMKVTTSAIQVATVAGGTALASTAGRTSSAVIPYTSTNLTVTTLTTSTNLVTVSAAHNLVAGNVVVFGSAVGPFNAGTYYYVLTTPATTTLTLALTQGGSAIAIAANATVSVTATGYYTFTNSSFPSMASFAPSTGRITMTNGSTNQLAPGMPIVFGSSFGTVPTSPTATPTNIVAGRTYYVASSPAPTPGASGTFLVSLTPGGPVILFTGASSTTSSFAAFALAGGPPSFRIQTPSLLVGLATSLNNAMGLSAADVAGNSLIITVYRTPASGGPTTATSFTVTYSPNNATTVNNINFNSSLSLAAGDRIQALAVSQGSSVSRDITADLIIV